MLPLLRYIEVKHIKDEIRFCETNDINHGVRFELTMVSQKYSFSQDIYIYFGNHKKENIFHTEPRSFVSKAFIIKKLSAQALDDF